MDYLTKIVETATEIYSTFKGGLNYLLGNSQPVYATINGNYDPVTSGIDFNKLEWNVCFSKRQKGGKHQDKKKGHGSKKKTPSDSKQK